MRTKENEDAQAALDLCEEILIDAEDIPERGENFKDSIVEKVESIKQWVEENNKVTDKQLAALENMHKGVLKWTA